MSYEKNQKKQEERLKQLLKPKIIIDAEFQPIAAHNSHKKPLKAAPNKINTSEGAVFRTNFKLNKLNKNFKNSAAAKKTIKQKIYELLSDFEDRNSEEISKELGISIDAIKKVLYRDSKIEPPNTRFFYRRYKKGNNFYYTLSGIFAKDIKDVRIQRLERENETIKQELKGTYALIKSQDKKIEKLKKN